MLSDARCSRERSAMLAAMRAADSSNAKKQVIGYWTEPQEVEALRQETEGLVLGKAAGPKK